MKLRITLAFALFSAFLIFFSCDQEEPPRPVPQNGSPGPTGLDENEEFIRLNVNGRPWPADDSVSVRVDFSGRYFLAMYFNTKTPELNMAIVINEDPIKVQTYELGASSADGSSSAVVNYTLDEEKCSYQFTDVVEGRVHITEFDTINHICRGSFEFKSFNQRCDTVKITNGQFASTLDM